MAIRINRQKSSRYKQQIAKIRKGDKPPQKDVVKHIRKKKEIYKQQIKEVVIDSTLMEVNEYLQDQNKALQKDLEQMIKNIRLYQDDYKKVHGKYANFEIWE